MANSTSAVMIDSWLSPNGGSASASSTSTAKVGTARPTLPTFSATVPPRPTWPSHSPSGTTRTAATSSEMADTRTCSPSRAAAPSGPDQFAPLVSQATVSLSQLIGRPRGGRTSCRTTPAPRRRGPLGGEQQQVDGEGERHAEHRGGENLRLEQRAQTLVDQVAEPPVADDRAHRRQ